MSPGSMEIKRKHPPKWHASGDKPRGRNNGWILFLKFPVMSWMTLGWSFNLTLLQFSCLSSGTN